MHADRSIGSARAARHETLTRPPGEFAVRLGHEGRSTLLPIDHELDFAGMRMKAVQHRQITFTRHAKRMRCALRDQAFDQQMTGYF